MKEGTKNNKDGGNELLKSDDSMVSEFPIDHFKLKILKTIYFFLYASFGSLWPYIILYFRQIGLQPHHAGSVAGIRPLVQFISCPFWTFIADKYSNHRCIFSISMISWLLMTLLLIVPTPNHYQCTTECVDKDNYNTTTDSSNSDLNYMNDSSSNLNKRQDVHNIKTFLINSQEVYHYKDTRVINSKLGTISNLSVDQFNQTSDKKGRTRRNIDKYPVTPINCSSVVLIVFDKDETIIIFLELFIITAFGEFFASPAIALLDMSILEELGPNKGHFYGRTRMFGSLGFGLASLGLGALLDLYPKNLCNHMVANYSICFMVFASIMLPLTILTTIYLKFDKIQFIKTSLKPKKHLL